MAATVITKLESSTVPVVETNFPKITLQNSYRLRYIGSKKVETPEILIIF